MRELVVLLVAELHLPECVVKDERDEKKKAISASIV